MPIPWLDEIVENSGAPRMADFEGARLIYNRITGGAMGATAFRRLPISYRLFHRTRRYEVLHVVEAAQRRIAEAPLRKPAPRRGKLTVGTTLNT
jgi:hypothetical protein